MNHPLSRAIVRNALQTCGGESVATLPENGGSTVTIHLPHKPLCPPDFPPCGKTEKKFKMS